MAQLLQIVLVIVLAAQMAGGARHQMGTATWGTQTEAEASNGML